MISTSKKGQSPQEFGGQEEGSIEHQYRPPSNAWWYLENPVTLNLKSFALRFGLTDK
jgi:hypothetical protein